MFTGIIESTGEISRIEQTGGDWRLHITCPGLRLSDVNTGDSIAVSGVCLTVTEKGHSGFYADVSRETLSCTTLRQLAVGALVNLEKALTPQSRLGGHIVSGHVDGVGELKQRKADGRSERLVFTVPSDLARYIAHKGSVCIDGVSLTVNEVSGNEFGVNIIPHTAQQTTIRDYRPGSRVNIEVDVISRYLERLINTGALTDAGVSLDKLRTAGFIAGGQV